MNAFRIALVAGTLALLAAACGDAGNEPTTTAPGLATLPPIETVGDGETDLGAEATTPTTTPTTVPLTLPPSPPSGVCRSYDDPVVTGTVTNPEVTETSGIAVSRTHPDVIWMHNDSGGGPFIYAATVLGDSMGAFELDLDTFDWEDMTIGPGPDPGRDYLYFGDIGDNFHFRRHVVIQRIAEPVPDPGGGFIAEVDEFNLVYPEPGHDAESMFVDPLTGNLVIITKPDAGGEALIYVANAADLTDGATIDLAPIGGFQLDPGLFVTAADIDSSGAVIVFRGYNEVWLWERTDLSFEETFAGEPCQVPSTAEVQGEAISFAADGYSYYTMSEGTEPDISYVFSIFD